MNGALVRTLMEEFADSTGITGKCPPRRYLWTDAFAVCNFLELFRQTGDVPYLNLAKQLVNQVHHVLGRHRDDDHRRGWISGLSEEEGEKHPTVGGLRIGKKLNERRAGETIDSQLEWDRDGQYFHYLTKWMHALHRVGQETQEVNYHQWAVELAIATLQKFLRTGGDANRLWIAWKMSIDLQRPLVNSMGQHDALDGLVACLVLQNETAKESFMQDELSAAISVLLQLCQNPHWVTDDPLGIGGLLDCASRLASLIFDHKVEQHDLFFDVLVSALASLQSLRFELFLDQPAQRRLAFRELGLAIGLRGMERVRSLCAGSPSVQSLSDEIISFQPVSQQIQEIWSASENRQNSTWRDHEDINSVMLATSLLPAGYLKT